MSGKTNDGFNLPPILTNADGKLRRAGFEFEYTGLDVPRSAEAVTAVFGGTSEDDGTFLRCLRTEFGEFSVEIDTSILKQKKYEPALRAIGLDLDESNSKSLEDTLVKLFSTLVPFEISTPPIPIDSLGLIEQLQNELRGRGAKGTKASIFYAFGFHINIEIPSTDATLLQNILRSFVLLYPWIKKRVDVDLTRRLSPYVHPFPDEYVRLILSEEYPTTSVEFVEDYLLHNPTRNRALDLLPVLATIDEEKVIAHASEPSLVKPRPAFHYRMPNCLLDDPSWSIKREWNTWVAVERLAADETKLLKMVEDYRDAERHSFKPFYDKWPSVLEHYMS